MCTSYRLLARDVLDICETREGCTDCNRNAPSQAATPPLPSPLPSTPFEAVFTDFFDYGGRNYLVVGDQLSGCVEILSSSAGTDLGGATGLIHHLQSFATFGIQEEISSDGGPSSWQATQSSCASGVYVTASHQWASPSPTAGQKLQLKQQNAC